MGVRTFCPLGLRVQEKLAIKVPLVIAPINGKFLELTLDRVRFSKLVIFFSTPQQVQKNFFTLDRIEKISGGYLPPSQPQTRADLC